MATLVRLFGIKSITDNGLFIQYLLKGTLPPYRERYDKSDISSHSFHSLESNGEQLHQQDGSTQMVISESLNQLNLT
jgi:hypothetical protein